MNISDLLSITGSVLLALGGGAAVVFALAKWLGGVWAARILENERLAGVREQELLIRRRNVYAKLSLTLRVFLKSERPSSPGDKKNFLEAYDEAALWASDDVMNAIGRFLDLNRMITASPRSVSKNALPEAYVYCITAMRKDCGFPDTEFSYRVVSFIEESQPSSREC